MLSEDSDGGRVGWAMQKVGPTTVRDMVKNSSTWTVTITEPRPTARQAGALPGPTTIGSDRTLPGEAVIRGRGEMLAPDTEGMLAPDTEGMLTPDTEGMLIPDTEGTMTVFVTTGGSAVVIVGPEPTQEQALSKRYATSP